MEHITLFLINGTWMAKSDSALVLSLFGTDTLPTPFTYETSASDVLAKIKALNPQRSSFSGGTIMAKLSAHGTELLRIEKYEGNIDSMDGSAYQTRRVKVYMSDGAILSKFYAQIKDYSGQLKWHDYGWKRAGRFAKQPDARLVIPAIQDKAVKLSWIVVSN